MNNDMVGTGAEVNSASVFELKPLQASDLFQMIRILRKLGISDIRSYLKPELISALDFKKPTMLDENGKEVDLPIDQWNDRQIEAQTRSERAQEELSMTILGMIVDRVPECEVEIYQLLANASGMDFKTMRSMPIMDFMNLLYAYVGRSEFKDFFMQAVKLLRSPGLNSLSGGSLNAITA